MKLVKSDSRFIQPSDLLEKAFEIHFPQTHFELYTEPYYEDGKPHWAFDNYRIQGAVNYNASHLFYTQPGWGKFFEVKMGRNKIKCVTYAIDPELHRPIDVEKEYDVGFIGELIDVTGERQVYLDAMRNNFNAFISDDVKTEAISEVYSKCKVIFNHIRYEEVNIRFFEAMGIGAQVVSYSPALHLLAKEGEHYVTYRSINEAINKIQYLLDNEDIRLSMANKAREHAVAFHTYKHRAKEMIDFL